MGLEGLFSARAFRVMTIEVDYAWGKLLPAWGITSVDQFVWLAHSNGYAPFLKVPCKAYVKDTVLLEPDTAAFYLPLQERVSFRADALHGSRLTDHPRSASDRSRGSASRWRTTTAK